MRRGVLCGGSPPLTESPVSRLKSEIAQQNPFSSPAEEALLNLLRTADCLQRAMQRDAKRWNITATQYNVLRILRGAHPNGLPCSSIGDRMITSDPDITRLLGRLKALHLIRQERQKKDKRVVTTYITDAGLALLKEMDETVSRFPDRMLGHLDSRELADFIRLLEMARNQCDERRTPGCDGNENAGIPAAADTCARLE
jgi:DNA-binding MarR family transcriptional regulator